MSSKRQKKLLARKREDRGAYQQEEEEEYIPPDPKTKITWPRALAGQVDDSRFLCLWPNNIDANKTIFRGRRISKAEACAEPIVQDMSEVCQYLKLTHVVEPFKTFPRDFDAFPGRIKVQLKTDDGILANPEIPTRKALMLKLGELIPKLSIRKQRLQQRELEYTNQKALAASSPTVAPTSGQAGTAGGNKKKGKKKGRR